MNRNVNNFLTWINNTEDIPHLRTRLLDVNMRLFHSSPQYKKIVEQCCNYIREMALASLDGYSKPFGMSGANLAIPFNIIGVVLQRGKPGEVCHIMINPYIRARSTEITETLSNCGSIRLPQAIRVPRYDWVEVRWWDIDGRTRQERFTRQNHGFTIQHEIDHNLGILITDKRI